MEVLELEPLKEKKLKIIAIESEFPIEWWFEGTPKEKHDLVWNLNLISREYLHVIEGFIKKYKPDFAIEEKGSRWEDTISHDDPLEVLFKNNGINYQMVDISENAEAYLSSSLDETKSLITKLSNKIKDVLERNPDLSKKDYGFERLVLWKEYLQAEYEEQENEIRFKIREAWMMMKILKITQTFSEKKITALFILDSRHFNGITLLAEELGLELEKHKIKRTIKMTNNSDSEQLDNLIGKSILDLTPIKIKKKETSDKICYFFDTDDNASPFDINMAYDAGYDVVIPISKATVEKIPKLVQDAIFSRKPNSPTSFFIGGSNVEEGNKIAEKVIESLVPPFECPVIIDPRGSHTTASSIVAKTIEIASKHGINISSGEKVVILGAGPVGQIASILAAKIGCEVSIIETWDKSNENFIEKLAKELTLKAGTRDSKIKGKFAITDEEKYDIIKDATIIWVLAAAGVEILSSNIMSKLNGKKIIVDINLVPPYGVSGLKPKDNDIKIFPGIFGIGALALGRLKSRTEALILNEASKTKGLRIFDYAYAFKVANKLVNGSNIEVSF